MTTTIYSVPRSLRERILDVLVDDPGWHTGASIQQSLADAGWAGSLQRVYNELGRMVRKGELEKTRNGKLSTAPLTHYRIKG